jgi:hypothetical protein
LCQTFPGRRMNLCSTGGCALNIKWNSLLRDSGMFRAIWVPPFPNDSGAALGAACCEMVREGRALALQWDVYSGPDLQPQRPAPAWTASPCDERRLARILHEQAEPVVVLHGRAAVGPRALGNRSILASAVEPGMKDRLNAIKGRADYRPVAPVLRRLSEWTHLCSRKGVRAGDQNLDPIWAMGDCGRGHSATPVGAVEPGCVPHERTQPSPMRGCPASPRHCLKPGGLGGVKARAATAAGRLALTLPSPPGTLREASNTPLKGFAT